MTRHTILGATNVGCDGSWGSGAVCGATLAVKVLLQIPDARYRRIKHERCSQTTFREGAGKRLSWSSSTMQIGPCCAAQ